MTVADDLEMLRRVIEHLSGGADAVRRAAAAESFASVDVSCLPDGTPDWVTVDLAAPVPLDQIESRFGPTRSLPASPAGGSAQVQFTDTLPADGAAGVTVLADVDGPDVVRVTLRFDDFR